MPEVEVLYSFYVFFGFDPQYCKSKKSCQENLNRIAYLIKENYYSSFLAFDFLAAAAFLGFSSVTGVFSSVSVTAGAKSVTKPFC